MKNEEIKFPLQLINEDGTDVNFEYPENPLREKWDKLYPPTQRYESGNNCEGYSCIFCGRCPHGSNWKVPTEDKEIWDEYQKQVLEYHKIHNPNLAKLLEDNSTISNENTRWEWGDVN